MTLTAKEVAEITRLLEESSFDELYLELDGLKLSLKRGGGASATSSQTARAAVVMTSQAPGTSPATAGSHTPPPPDSATAVPTASIAADPNVHNVTAPLLGTFYRAPKPGAPAFVEVGSAVQPDTIIGIIEVMKLMNTVRAGVQGQVTEIVARDGALVEYGETLLRVSR